MVKYETLKSIYKEQYAIDGLDLNEIVKLFNLVAFLYKAYKSKDADLTVYGLCTKVFKRKSFDPKTKEETWIKMEVGDIDHFLIPFSIQLDFYITTGQIKPSSYGMNSIKDIVQEINNIFDNWLPF